MPKSCERCREAYRGRGFNLTIDNHGVSIIEPAVVSPTGMSALNVPRQAPLLCRLGRPFGGAGPRVWL